MEPYGWNAVVAKAPVSGPRRSFFAIATGAATTGAFAVLVAMGMMGSADQVDPGKLRAAWWGMSAISLAFWAWMMLDAISHGRTAWMVLILVLGTLGGLIYASIGMTVTRRADAP
jgi:hypothetical protein